MLLGSIMTELEKNPQNGGELHFPEIVNKNGASPDQISTKSSVLSQPLEPIFDSTNCVSEISSVSIQNDGYDNSISQHSLRNGDITSEQPTQTCELLSQTTPSEDIQLQSLSSSLSSSPKVDSPIRRSVTFADNDFSPTLANLKQTTTSPAKGERRPVAEEEDFIKNGNHGEDALENNGIKEEEINR